MEFRIADTFTDSLAKLTGEEQKAVKTTAFDLQLDPANSGMQLHRVEQSRDQNFFSVRVSRDIRLIGHRTSSSMLLCYVDHHDDAYRWAERRRLETHPKTGAAQLVEVRETIQEVLIPRYVDVEEVRPPKPLLFAAMPEDELLSYGVPPEWLEDVRAADEDTILDLANHLPGEAAEALLDLAVGATPQVAAPAVVGTDPFEHPDALRRFRVMSNVEELERALDYPWDKWSVFLHPAQQHLVDRDFNGPGRVTGSAGTGKTIVALHRAVALARKDPEARVLLATFSGPLANVLRIKLRRLISGEPRLGERVEVHAIGAIGQRLYEMNLGNPNIASREQLRELVQAQAARAEGSRFPLHFLLAEWEQIVDAWQLETWESYRDVQRLGRKTRLPEKQRQVLWGVFAGVQSELSSLGLITESTMFTRLGKRLAEGRRPPFDHAVVDEAQDISVAQLRFLAGLGGGLPNGIFFAGDLGQRIFQQPFSWLALGVDVRGRSHRLRINYRTSHQIRMRADRLLPPELADVDGVTEERRGTVSVFNGPEPAIQVFDDPGDEVAAVGEWLRDLSDSGIAPHEIGLFVRSETELSRARAAADLSGLEYRVLDERAEADGALLSISTMHLAKGLEFRAVAVMACDDEVIPSQTRIEGVADDADLEDVYNTERHLLYVACTRARDRLLVTGVKPASEFLDDLSVTANSVADKRGLVD